VKKVLAFAAALVAGLALADKVTLKSGSFLTGEAGIIRDGKLQFKSEDLGEIQIAVSNIKSLDVAKSHVIQYADNSTEEKVLGIRNGALWIGKEKLDMSAVKATDPVVETWHGSINVAFNAARGNTYDDAVAVLANLNRRWEKDRLNADFSYRYGKSGPANSDAEKTMDRWEAEVKHDHFWLPKVYHFEDLRWDRDMIQGLQARYRVGAGGGYQWLDDKFFESTGKWRFNQEIGANWVKEEYENNPDQKDGGFCALRYGHHFGYVPKWTDAVEVFHNAEILPDVAEWDKFLARADIGFSATIIYGVDLLAKIEWDFDSKPSGDRKKDDLRYIVGLGYKW